MASHIPFINSTPDCDRLSKYYLDSEIIRVSLESIGTFRGKIPKKMLLWIDPAIDGYDNLLYQTKKTRDEWKDYIEQFEESDFLSNSNLINRPNPVRLQKFVDSVLDKCLELKPSWISVPQLPLVNDTSRNKINRALAKASSQWGLNRQCNAKLILPLIFTHKDQSKGKVQWKAKLNVAKKCYELSNAKGIWAVDSSLNDQQGSVNLDKRFAQLIELHRDLKKLFAKKALIIAGPYWGLNLVLWARELCDYVAVTLGTAYRYYISGGFMLPGKARLAIPPLRRCAIADPKLKQWLEEALNRISPTDPAFIEISKLKNKYTLLSQAEIARDQVANVWKEWFNKIDNLQPKGRTLALYQDLSSAYVLGKQLPELPRSEGTARFPERVAQQLMLNCL